MCKKVLQSQSHWSKSASSVKSTQKSDLIKGKDILSKYHFSKSESYPYKQEVWIFTGLMICFD